jgi:hypothetical protein
MAISTGTDPITWSELGISFGVYIVWIAAVLIFASTTRRGARVFSIFTNSLMRVAIALVMLTTVGALTMFYLDIMAATVAGILLFISLLAVGYFLHKRPSNRLSWYNALTLVSLLIYLVFPAVLTIWKRDNMSDTVELLVWISTALFWTMSFLSYWFMPDFATEVNPFGKTITLLILLCLSMWMLLYSTGTWSVTVILILSFLAFLILSLYRKDKILSMSLGSHQRHPAAAAFMVGTTLYATGLSLTLALAKDQEDKDDQVFTLTALLASLAILWICGVVAFEAIHMYSKKSKEKTDAQEVSLQNSSGKPPSCADLDMFGVLAWKTATIKVSQRPSDSHVPHGTDQVVINDQS